MVRLSGLRVRNSNFGFRNEGALGICYQPVQIAAESLSDRRCREASSTKKTRVLCMLDLTPLLVRHEDWRRCTRVDYNQTRNGANCHAELTSMTAVSKTGLMSGLVSRIAVLRPNCKGLANGSVGHARIVKLSAFSCLLPRHW